MLYNLTAERLEQVLPIADTLTAATIRNYLSKVAHRHDTELEAEAGHITACPKVWSDIDLLHHLTNDQYRTG